MKTSNYILIALFTFVVGSILVLFIAAIGHEDELHGGDPNLEKKEYLLEDFSVIVVEPETYIEFNSSEANSLSFFYSKDVEANEKPFRISNDTVFTFQTAALDHRQIFVSGNNLSAVIVKEGGLFRAVRFNSETLSVDLQQAKFIIDESDIRKLNVLGDKAGIQMYSSNIESLSARLKNESSLDMHRNVNKVDIEKDETSTYLFSR